MVDDKWVLPLVIDLFTLPLSLKVPKNLRQQAECISSLSHTSRESMFSIGEMGLISMCCPCQGQLDETPGLTA